MNPKTRPQEKIMCGFIGFVGKSPCPQAVLDAMSQAIAHRGPDEGTILSARTRDSIWHVDIAFRRLAIIDLSRGSQPMADPSGRYRIVFNGEIYNFKILRQALQELGHELHSTSDTEVLLHAYLEWKEDCVSYLIGMFAFGIWDDADGSLFIARDRFGKKPFYYTLTSDGGLVFGSEIGGLLHHPDVSRDLDVNSLRTLLAWRYAPGPHTLFSDIKKLPPASRMTWRDGALAIDQYWIPPDAHIAPPAYAEADPLPAFE